VRNGIQVFYALYHFTSLRNVHLYFIYIDLNIFYKNMENIFIIVCSTIARNYDDMCGKEGKKYINKLDNNMRFVNW